MCGRYTLISINKIRPFTETIIPHFDSERFQPRFNICPSQNVPVILNDGSNAVREARWGLIPAWAKDPSIGNKLANARSEGIETKPSFRNSFKRRRCLVLADGFYEWANQPGEKLKVPYYFRLKDQSVYGFAGLWDTWRDPSGKTEILSCCLITTTPNAIVEDVHDRMPVILQPEFIPIWLSKDEQPVEQLKLCLEPYPAEQMESFMVSRIVNSPSNNKPECVQPV
jgi:putative SOS response-associated peptidase YedK